MSSKDISLYISADSSTERTISSSDFIVSGRKILLVKDFIDSSTAVEAQDSQQAIYLPVNNIKEATNILEMASKAISGGIAAVEGKFYAGMYIGAATDISVSKKNSFGEFQSIATDRDEALSLVRQRTGTDWEVTISGISIDATMILTRNLDADRRIGFIYTMDATRYLAGAVKLTADNATGQIDALAQFSFTFAGSGVATYIIKG